MSNSFGFPRPWFRCHQHVMTVRGKDGPHLGTCLWVAGVAEPPGMTVPVLRARKLNATASVESWKPSGRQEPVEDGVIICI